MNPISSDDKMRQNRATTTIRVHGSLNGEQQITHIYWLIPTAARDSEVQSEAHEWRFQNDAGIELEVMKDHMTPGPRVWRVLSTGEVLTEIR
ncbi:MAG: hypothetical protein ABI213_18365 [Rhodoferax sp.]